MSAPERILLVASPGGHLQQMLALEPAWSGLRRSWATLRRPDAIDLLADEDVVFAHGPTERNIPNLLRNLWLAWRTIRRYRPHVILSTGAALAVPFFVVGRLLGVRLVYVESLTRVHELALSGRLVYPIADSFFVQWRMASPPPRAIYAGSVA